MKKFNSILILIIIVINIFANHAIAKSKTKKVKLATAGKIYVPKMIESFKLSKTKKFPQADLGVAFTYRNDKLPQVQIDYYIYPVYDTVSIENVMFAEYNNIIEGIKALAERDDGILSILNVEVIDANKQHAIKTTMNMDIKQGTYISELYLTSVNGHYIKFRASYPMYDSKEFGLRKLSETIFKQLLSETRFKSKKKHKYSISLDPSALDTDNEVAMAEVILYGFSVQTKLPKDLVDSYDNFFDIYDLFISIDSETDKLEHEKINTGKNVIDYIVINNAGFLREFIWLAFNRPYWVQPKDLKIQEFQLWLEKNKSEKLLSRPAAVDILIQR